MDSSRIMFSKSIDRGVSWSDPKIISFYNGDCLDGDKTVEGAVPVLGINGTLFVTWTGPRGLMMQQSSDGGETWLPVERCLMQQPGGWDFKIPGIYRCNGLPVLNVDRSKGEHQGTLYLSWSDQRNGVKDTDIWLIKIYPSSFKVRFLKTSGSQIPHVFQYTADPRPLFSNPYLEIERVSFLRFLKIILEFYHRNPVYSLEENLFKS